MDGGKWDVGGWKVGGGKVEVGNKGNDFLDNMSSGT